MNRRQSVFVRELGSTALIIAGYLEGSVVPGELKGSELLSDAIWKSMYHLRPEVRTELGGLLRGSAAGDGFEISDWFEQMRRDYGKCSQVLTFCQILCCIFRTGCRAEGAAALRVLSGALWAAYTAGGEPDMIAVWQYLIRYRNEFFGSIGSIGGSSGTTGVQDADIIEVNKKAVLGRMLVQLCCCAGNDRRYADQARLIFWFLREFASEPEDKEGELSVTRLRELGGDARLFSALEAAYD